MSATSSMLSSSSSLMDELHNLHLRYQVWSEVLQPLIFQISRDEKEVLLQELSKEQHRYALEKSTQEQQWHNQAALLQAQTQQLVEQQETLTQHIDSLQHTHTKLLDSVHILAEEDAHFRAHIKAQRNMIIQSPIASPNKMNQTSLTSSSTATATSTSASTSVSSSSSTPSTQAFNLSALPPLALRSIMSHLTLSEFSQVQVCCKEWKQLVQAGYLWRIYALRLRQTLKHADKLHQEEVEKQKLFNAPIHLSITLSTKDGVNGSNPSATTSGGLEKKEMFTRCLAYVRRQLDPTLSEYEDLSLKLTSQESIRAFLSQQLEQIKHEVGMANVRSAQAHEAWTETLTKKEALASSIRHYEDGISQERALRASLEKAHSASTQLLSNQLTLLQDLASHTEQALHGADGDDAHKDEDLVEKKEREQAIATLKQQRKILIKGVKGLRSEIQAIQQEREEYTQKLAALKHKLQAV